jgi:hypothetical protein
MSSVRDSPSRSMFIARQLGWLELLEAGLHVVGIVVVVGSKGGKPAYYKGTGGPTYLREISVKLDTH